VKTPEEKITRIIDNATARGELSWGDVVALFVVTRELLESKGIKQKFPRVNMYCNWMVHTKLSRESAVFEMLESATSRLIEHGASNPNDVLLNVSELFFVDELRDQLAKLFHEYGLSTVFFEDARNWNGIFSAVLDNLENKPIEYPDKVKLNGKGVANKHYTRAYKKACGDEVWIVTELSLAIDDKNKVHWKLQTHPKINITGRFLKTGTIASSPLQKKRPRKRNKRAQKGR